MRHSKPAGNGGYVALWHKPDLRLAASERPLTSAFRTLGAEGRRHQRKNGCGVADGRFVNLRHVFGIWHLSEFSTAFSKLYPQKFWFWVNFFVARRTFRHEDFSCATKGPRTRRSVRSEGSSDPEQRSRRRILGSGAAFAAKGPRIWSGAGREAFGWNGPGGVRGTLRSTMQRPRV